MDASTFAGGTREGTHNRTVDTARPQKERVVEEWALDPAGELYILDYPIVVTHAEFSLGTSKSEYLVPGDILVLRSGAKKFLDVPEVHDGMRTVGHGEGLVGDSQNLTLVDTEPAATRIDPGRV